MSGLKCTTRNCEHNCNCHCNAGVIFIGKNGACKTKQKREYGVLEQEKTNIEAAKDFDFNENDQVCIQCDSTKCCYNYNNACCSQIVNVADGMMRTKCFTKRVDK